MQANVVKERLKQGGSAFGGFGWELLVPGLPQIVRNSGGQFLLIDMEHSGVSYETLKAQCALCRGIELIPMARLPANHYHYISRALDVGVMGIMAPMVESAKEAREIVAFTRYPPFGRRGAAFGMAADDYLASDIKEKIESANRRTLIMCQIETDKGLANVDEIAAVDGVDVLWLGHFDLTNFLGIPGNFSHPKYRDAIDRIVDAAQTNNKVLACMTSDSNWSHEYWGKGFRMFAVSIDAILLQRGLTEGINELNRLANKEDHYG